MTGCKGELEVDGVSVTAAPGVVDIFFISLSVLFARIIYKRVWISVVKIVKI